MAKLLITAKAFYLAFSPVSPASIYLGINQSLDSIYRERRIVEQHWFKSCNLLNYKNRWHQNDENATKREYSEMGYPLKSQSNKQCDFCEDIPSLGIPLFLACLVIMVPSRNLSENSWLKSISLIRKVNS